MSIDQKGVSHNPRSTVGTVTEVYDYLRLLFARVGVPHCPICGREVRQQSAQEIVDAIETLPDGTRLLILAPLVRGRKGTHQNVFDDARRSGFVRLRVNGQVRGDRGRDRAGPLQEPHHRGGRRPAGAPARHRRGGRGGAHPPDRLDRDGAALGQPAR